FPFSQPRELDAVLERAAWGAFDRTLVLKLPLAQAREPAVPDIAIELLAPPAWETQAARLLKPDPESLERIIARAAAHPLPQTGAVLRQDGEPVACGLLKLEGACAGLFAVHTAASCRGRGYARAIVAALLAEARRRGASLAYLQVTADNAPALAVYER